MTFPLSATCIHGAGLVLHDGRTVGCAFCSGESTTRKPGFSVPKPPRPPVQGAPISVDERNARLVAAGVLCEKCMTDPRGRGCACSRAALYDEAHGAYSQVERFARRVIAESGLTTREATNVAVTAMGRRARFGSQLADDTSADRRDMRRRIDPEAAQPQWFKPHRHEADHLPV